MLSEAKFNAIVAMIKGGATDEIIMASQGINEKTLRNIKNSNGDYEKYRTIHGEMIRNANKTKRKDPGEKNNNVYGSNLLLQEMKIQSEHLKSISEKLAFIVCELTGVKQGGMNNETTL